MTVELKIKVAETEKVSVRLEEAVKREKETGRVAVKREDEVVVKVTGTPFQVAVWRALTEIPSGEVVTYSDIAARIGHPGAVRAVGSAVGANPYPVLIPCHRVVPKNGGTGNYHYGAERKKMLLELEGAITAEGVLTAEVRL